MNSYIANELQEDIAINYCRIYFSRRFDMLEFSHVHCTIRSEWVQIPEFYVHFGPSDWMIGRNNLTPSSDTFTKRQFHARNQRIRSYS